MTVTKHVVPSGSAAPQQWQVPSNVVGDVFVELYGANGGGQYGGKGGYARGFLTVTPGDVLKSLIGKIGGNPIGGTGGQAGFNGGGQGGNSTGAGGLPACGGGGMTQLMRYDLTLIAIAGGGGGEGRNTVDLAPGGKGGGATGTAGSGGTHTGHATGGGGGTQTAGGARGAPGGSASDSAAAGSSLQGGHGSNHATAGYAAGGGGGGGYFGGGGGGGSSASTSGGGGGGSSRNELLTAFSTVAGVGSTSGDGEIWITFDVAPNQPALLSPVGSANVDSSKPLDLAWAFSSDDSLAVQTKADIRWRVAGGGWNTILSAVLTADGFYEFPAHTFDAYIDQAVEWQVETYTDGAYTSDLQSPWSASGFFVPVAHPADFVYSPAPVIDSNIPSVEGARSDAGPILTYQIQVWDDASGAPNELVTDKTINLTDAATSVDDVTAWTPFVNGLYYHFLTRIAYPVGVWSDWADSGPVLANIHAPLPPTAVVTPVPEVACVQVDITNPSGDPYPPVRNEVRRTDVVTGVEVVCRGGSAVGVNTVFIDWDPGFHRQYRYRVVAINDIDAQTSSE